MGKSSFQMAMNSFGPTPPKVKKIVTLKKGQSSASCSALVEQHGGKIIKELPLINAVLCEFAKEQGLASLLSRSEVLNVHNDIKIKILVAEPKEVINKAVFYSPLFYPVRRRKSSQANQEAGWNMEMIGAWPYKAEGKQVKVGIMDTGIEINHEDLQENIKGGINIMNPGASFTDNNGHGTHVAGIIGARNNDVGIVGVAPEVDLYGIKVLDANGEGNLSDAITGLQWAIDNDVKIVNMSFGSTEDNDAYRQAFQAASREGLIMVAAAGNEKKYDSVTYPAKYSEVIAVSALNKQGGLAEFSSWGKEVGIAAPGESIRSTYLNSDYKELSGTSMAAPHVTGAIARMMGKYGSNRAPIIMHMRRTASWMPGLNSEQQGAGMINVSRALQWQPR